MLCIICNGFYVTLEDPYYPLENKFMKSLILSMKRKKIIKISWHVKSNPPSVKYSIHLSGLPLLQNLQDIISKFLSLHPIDWPFHRSF